MQICARVVRCTSCRNCLHCKECEREGAPASALGRYMAFLKLEALKRAQIALRVYSGEPLNIKIRMRYGVPTLVCTRKANVIFRVPLQMEETQIEIEEALFAAYERTRKNGLE